MVILYDLIVKMASGDQGGRMNKKYRAVVFKMPNNSDKAERRYVIKDMESGVIVDDAMSLGQGGSFLFSLGNLLAQHRQD